VREQDAATGPAQTRGSSRSPRSAAAVAPAPAPAAAQVTGSTIALASRARLPAQAAAQHNSHNLHSANGAHNSHNARLPPLNENVKRVSELSAELMTIKSKLALQEQKLREQPGVPNTECIVCMDAAVDTVLLPCGHLCMCSDCASSLTHGAKVKGQPLKCPLCRLNANTSQRIYLHVEKPASPPRILQSHVRSRNYDPAAERPAITRVKLSANASAQVPRPRPSVTSMIRREEAQAAYQPALVENSSVIFSKSMPAGFALRRPTSAVW